MAYTPGDLERNIAYCETKVADTKQRIKMAEVTGEDVSELRERQKGFEKALKAYKSEQAKTSA